MAAAEPLLSITGLWKSYAAPVLLDVALDLRRGEVHALVGENGAGKTTLARILSGLTRPDRGAMRLAGQPYAPASKGDAERHGIRMVMQELHLVGNLSVAENIFLGRLPRRLGVVTYRRLHAEARAAMARVGLQGVPPERPVRELGVGQQQLVEIAAGLSGRCELLILDEPTAALTDPEVARLFDQIRHLKAAGAAILYISHRMEEIFQIADRITVLRDGRVVATRVLGTSAVRERAAVPNETPQPTSSALSRESAEPTQSPPGPPASRPMPSALSRESAEPTQSPPGPPPSRPMPSALSRESAEETKLETELTDAASLAPVTLDEIIRLMVGRNLGEAHPSARRPPGKVALRAVGLRRGTAVRDVSFEVREGEILGFAGLMGSGRTETLRLVFGADRPDAGAVYLYGADRPARIRSPRDAVRAGIALLTEDRKSQGLLLPLPVRHNVTIARLGEVAGPGGLLDGARERAVAERLAVDLAIQCRSVEQPVAELSGGNQQKVVVAKWLFRDCRVLLFDEPTRGIDVGAKFAIYKLLGDLAERGKAIVVASSDLLELLAICDRIAVMTAGRLAATFQRGEWTQDKIMAAALSGYVGAATG